ncbi:hypothetical protein [Micromonospora aurantiaca (nom. illeg.)]|uniref:hypothetical protein n=1 Tax=Micromonospora aurantiaca (nom. illeg.) TaxID=47850 RepID=UPI003F4A0340
MKTEAPGYRIDSGGRGLRRVVNFHGTPMDVFTNDMSMVLHKKFIKKSVFNNI